MKARTRSGIEAKPAMLVAGIGFRNDRRGASARAASRTL